MTAKQAILKAVYPVWIWVTKLTGRNTKVLKNEKHIPPDRSVYDIPVVLNTGETLPPDKLKGKKILLVNTASDCGYTKQYADLQQLYEQFHDRLIIIGFPANDFKQQEKGTDQEIAQFCKVNYGVTFPLTKKSVVVKSREQHPLFQWLTDKRRNGWNDQAPSWNFSKYLVDEQGVLTHYFDPSVSPVGKEVLEAVTH